MSVPKEAKLFYRLYPAYIEASQPQIKAIKKEAYYRLSVWEQDHQLAEMTEGISPAILGGRIFFSQSSINFSTAPKPLTLKLIEYLQGGEKEIASGVLDIGLLCQNFHAYQQRFASLQESMLRTSNGEVTLVFNAFVEKSKYDLDTYIKKFRASEKQAAARMQIDGKQVHVGRATSIQRRQTHKDASLVQPKVADQIHPLRKSMTAQDPKLVRVPLEAPDLPYGQAYDEQKVGINLNGKQKLEINDVQQREYNAYSSMMSSYQKSNHKVALDIGVTASIISDGSEISLMRERNEKVSYSEKAVRQFQRKTGNCITVSLVLLGLVLLMFALSPSHRSDKAHKKRKAKRARSEWS